MRWRFIHPNRPADLRAKQATLQRIEDWWQRFAAAADSLDAKFSRKGDIDVVAFMRQHLGAIDPRLCWEYGAGLHQPGHRLVITPESNAQLRPIVDTLLERAPALPRWEFFPYRLPGSVPMAYHTVAARCSLPLQSAEVRLARGGGNRIDLTFRSPQYAGLTESAARHTAFVLAETLLGEELLDHWVGAIMTGGVSGGPPPLPSPGTVRPPPPPLPGPGMFLPLERLQPTFASLVDSIQDQLPDQPLHTMGLTTGAGTWTQFQVDAARQEGYPHRGDIFIGSSCMFEVTRAAARAGFWSGRFSRFDETFAYLKLDRTGVPRERWVPWRAAFEDALEPSLRSAAAGCIYAIATGMKYSYIDLALADVQRAVPILRQVLCKAQAPLNSWLLFSDPHLADEWVGIWDETPPPVQPAE